MDFIPNDPILQFHPDALVTVRKLHNLDKKEDMNEAINLLDDWVQKQRHFTKKDFSRDYLERSIIMLKGSVERTKMQLDKICTTRTLLPKFYANPDPKVEFEILNGRIVHALLPKLTDKHYRVWASKHFSSDLSPNIFFSFFRYAILFFEYMKSFDYSDGFVAIADYRNINIVDFVSNLNLLELREALVIATECYQLRMKAIHIVTESKAVDILLKILKQMVSEKIGGRFHVHKNLDSLYGYVPKESLPKEFGGKEKSLVDLSNDWINLLSTKENIKHFREMSEARTDESLRETAKFNEQYMGMAGSFRRLNMD